jgi:hypothetical protein
VHHRFVRECVALGQVGFKYVSTAANAADMLTKPLAIVKHAAFCNMTGVQLAAAMEK